MKIAFNINDYKLIIHRELSTYLDILYSAAHLYLALMTH